MDYLKLMVKILIYNKKYNLLCKIKRLFKYLNKKLIIRLYFLVYRIIIQKTFCLLPNLY